jgi:hypothetical protein
LVQVSHKNTANKDFYQEYEKSEKKEDWWYELDSFQVLFRSLIQILKEKFQQYSEIFSQNLQILPGPTSDFTERILNLTMEDNKFPSITVDYHSLTDFDWIQITRHHLSRL